MPDNFVKYFFTQTYEDRARKVVLVTMLTNAYYFQCLHTPE